MEKDYKKYDEICATALNWILWNKKEHMNERFCITNINSTDSEDLWFLSILHCASAMIPGKIYIETRFSDYLYLKYKKKYKFLRYNFFAKNNYYIDVVLFEDELLKQFNEPLSTLGEIYYEYYRR